MTNNSQVAYTGPSPATGYVGYVNLALIDGELVFTVRPESTDCSGTATHQVPVVEARQLLMSALDMIDTASSRIKGDKDRENPVERPQPIAWMYDYGGFRAAYVRRHEDLVEKGYPETLLYAEPIEITEAHHPRPTSPRNTGGNQ